jgi:hypothetical protein
MDEGAPHLMFAADCPAAAGVAAGVVATAVVGWAATVAVG